MKRPLLTREQCRVFLSDMREFGYPNLTLERVEAIAKQVAEGSHSRSDVIAVIMTNQIDDAVNDAKSS